MDNNFEFFYKIIRNDYDDIENPTYFERPQIIDIMESNGLEYKTADAGSLQYFHKPESSSYPLDLNDGFEDYKFRLEYFFQNNLSLIEEYLMRNTSNQSEANEKFKIYTTRLVLYKLMIIPYRLYPNAYNDITICATQFGDVMYLSADTGSERGCTKNDTYHYKFQQFCFSDSPESQPHTDVPIDENIQTASIFRSQLENFDIVYSAEINGIKSDKAIRDPANLEALNQCRFVMTKLLKATSYPWRENKKILNWWTQAYLVNVNDIYMGIKGDDGKVDEPVQHVVVKDLPKNQTWKPRICIRFLHEFLKIIQRRMANVNCPYTVYEFQYDSWGRCINYRINEGRTEKSFLTEQFIEHMQKK